MPVAPDASAEQVQPITSNEDVVRARRLARSLAVGCELSLVDQTKLVTAASELARNTLIYGGGGSMAGRLVRARGRVGVALRFEDRGPGIADVELAMSEGWSSGSGLGLGLSGTRRLVDEFELETEPGTGTTVRVVKWSH